MLYGNIPIDLLSLTHYTKEVKIMSIKTSNYPKTRKISNQELYAAFGECSIACDTIRKDKRFNTAVYYAGNKKLVDTPYVAYMQYNLAPVVTCPFASDDCKLFCYALNSEWREDVQAIHKDAMQQSLAPDFVEKTIMTIRVALDTNRYKNRLALMRLHESGDFYSLKYTCDWLDIMNGTKDKNITYHFYTKSFQFFLDMDDTHKAIFCDLLASGTLAVNWSVDYSTNAEQWERVEQLKALYPMTNIYFALPDTDIIESHFTHVCKCYDCGGCRVCSIASGALTACGIH